MLAQFYNILTNRLTIAQSNLHLSSGPGYRKRTHLAHSENIQWNPRPLCDPKSCEQCVNGKHVKTAQRGKQSNPKQKRDNDTCTLDQLHGLPRELTEEIYRICNNQLWQLV